MSNKEHGQGENLVVVYRAPDQYTANVVKGLLATEDIPVVLESRQVAWLDGVMAMGEGYWGDVVVPKQDRGDQSKLDRRLRGRGHVNLKFVNFEF